MEETKKDQPYSSFPLPLEDTIIEDQRESRLTLMDEEATERTINTTEAPTFYDKEMDRTFEDLFVEIQEEEASEPRIEKYKRYAKYGLICGIIGLVFVFITKKFFGEAFFTQIFSWIRKFSNSGSFSSYLFLIGLQCFFSWVILPGLTYCIVSMGFFMKQFWTPWLIATFGGYFAALFCFVVVRKLLKGWMTKKYAGNALYQVILEETKENPWAISVLTNCLIIPTAFKNTIMPLTEMTFFQFALPKLPFYMFFSGIFTFMGMELDSVEQIMGHKSMSEWSAADLLNFVVGIVMLLATVLILVLFSVVVSKKLEFIKQKEKRLKIEAKFEEKLKRIGMSEMKVKRMIERQRERGFF